MLQKLFFPHIVPGEQIVLSTVQTLLEPLRKSMPEVVEITLLALRGGRAPAEAAQALAKALSAHEKTIAEEREAAARKNSAELETKLEQLSREMDRLKKDMAKQEKEGFHKDNLIQEYQLTIENQNRLLAEQHKKLSLLFRSDD
jgi:chromosome segregation ATPase